MDSTDEALWAAARSGDGDAFAALFDRHHGRVHRHSARLLTTAADADDVTAATFLELWRRRDDVHPTTGSLLPWLLVTATNLTRNTTRSTRRYRDLLHRLHHQPAPHRTPDVADVAEVHTAAHLDEPLATALRVLRTPDLQLITLVVLEDLTLTEAATVLGLSPGAAKTRLHRARTRLRTALADHPAASRLRAPEGQHP
ncbi:RNA polymerase sigma factor [Kineococcus sp. TBRC 1896]|uniref:RNA polymerase sigma factor n=1 Tax=Kineococcus mangrovi TaxID=1660183 RepID=A0ABV4I7S7_9ACTN